MSAASKALWVERSITVSTSSANKASSSFHYWLQLTKFTWRQTIKSGVRIAETRQNRHSKWHYQRSKLWSQQWQQKQQSCCTASKQQDNKPDEVQTLADVWIYKYIKVPFFGWDEKQIARMAADVVNREHQFVTFWKVVHLAAFTQQ